jgi:hypothetical protein
MNLRTKHLSLFIPQLPRCFSILRCARWGRQGMKQHTVRTLGMVLRLRLPTSTPPAARPAWNPVRFGV